MTEGLGNGGGGYGHSGGGPYRVPAARAPPGTTEGGAVERETAGDLGDGGGGNDHDSGGGGGGVDTECPSRPKPARWPQMTNSQRRNWYRRRN